MNCFLKKSLLLTTLFSFSVSYADIPAMESVGIFEATKDEYKEVSPLWGFIALQGEMLEYIRFFGNFKQDKDQRGRPITVPEDKDPIAKLIYMLFPSTDGVSFVANTHSGFVGEVLSKNLHVIGEMVAILHKSKGKKISHKDLVSQLEGTLSSPSKLFNVLLKSQPDIGIWKQKISEKVALSSEQTQNLYQKLMQKKGKQIPLDFFLNKLLTTINSNKKKEDFDLKKTITHQINTSKDQDIKDFFLKTVVLGGLGKDKIDFFETLSHAFLMEHSISHNFNNDNSENNPGENKYSIYPKNIVAISLLSFFVKVANQLSALLRHKIEPKKIFTEDDYYNLKSNLQNLDSEHLFLLSAGYETYEALFKKDAPFRTGVFCRKPHSQNAGKDMRFPDCGETSLRNFFTLLLPSQDERINLALLKQRVPNLNEQLVAFFEKWHSSIPSRTESAHNEWADLIFKQDHVDNDLNSPRYSRKILDNDTAAENVNPKSPSNNCDIAPGLTNMINVIATLVPDPVLQEPWQKGKYGDINAQQIARKLTKLCDLMSSENHKVSWSSDSRTLGDYVSITFLVNGQQAYVWEFTAGHFDFKRVSNSGNDWRTQYIDLSWSDEWISSLFSANDPFKSQKTPIFLYPIIYHSSLRKIQAEGVFDRIDLFLLKDLKEFYPLAVKWIKREILDFDPPRGLELWKEFMQAHLSKKLIQSSNVKGVLDFIEELHRQLSEKDFETILSRLIIQIDSNPDLLKGIIHNEYYAGSENLTDEIANKAAQMGYKDLVNHIIQSGKKPKFQAYALTESVKKRDKELRNLLLEHDTPVHENALVEAANQCKPKLLKTLSIKHSNLQGYDLTEILMQSVNCNENQFNEIIETISNQKNFSHVVVFRALKRLLGDVSNIENIERMISKLPPEEIGKPSFSVNLFEALFWQAQSPLQMNELIQKDKNEQNKIKKNFLDITNKIFGFSDHSTSFPNPFIKSLRKGEWDYNYFPHLYPLFVYKKILNHGFDVNEQDGEGNTALHYILKKGDSYFDNSEKDSEFISIIRLFIEKGAATHIKNNNGVTAMDIVNSQWSEGVMIRITGENREKIEALMQEKTHHPIQK